MIAGDGRLSAEVEAKTMRPDLRSLQQYGDAFSAILGNGKTDPRAIRLTSAVLLHPFGMRGDVLGAQTAAE